MHKIEKMGDGNWLAIVYIGWNVNLSKIETIYISLEKANHKNILSKTADVKQQNWWEMEFVWVWKAVLYNNWLEKLHD